MYQLYLKHLNPQVVNLELRKETITIAFSNISLCLEYLYMFGKEFLDMVIQQTEYTLSTWEKVSSNQLYNEFCSEFITRQPSLHDDFQKFMHHIVFQNGKMFRWIEAIQEYEKKTNKNINNITKRIAGVYFNIKQFYNPQTALYNASSKLQDLQTAYQEHDEQLFIDQLYFPYLYKIDNYETAQYHTLKRIKWFGEPSTMEVFADNMTDKISKLISYKDIDTICVIPNNVLRPASFNNHLLHKLETRYLSTKNIIYIHKNPSLHPSEYLAQKTIKGLAWRLLNANKLFTIDRIHSDWVPQRILVIDDIVSSWATMNMISKKIKKNYPDAMIIGYSFLGSYRKWFDVVNEV